MKEIILLKDGEIALKGLNRHAFEDRLIKNARRKLAPVGSFHFKKAQSTIYVEPDREDYDLDDAVERLQKVFGIAALTRACVVEKDIEVIKRTAAAYLKEELEGVSTFKVEAKRSDKTFPLKSPAICAEVGGYLLEQYPHLTVDVHEPDLVVMVEVRDFAAYVHGGQIKGAGGIPVGSGGKAMLLISGGIDSPVAGYMMAKRGLEIQAIHFVSPPYTSERAKQKVIDSGAEDVFLLRAHQAAHRALHRDPGGHPRPVPGGPVHHHHAAVHDEDRLPGGAPERVRGADHR